MISRADRGPFAQWWWTVDRAMLAAVIILMACGLVLSFAASPSVARHLELSDFYFVKRQMFFLVPSFVLLVGVSFLSIRSARRLCLLILVVSLLLMLGALIMGIEIKGARRWITVAGWSLQPSEFMKPAFVVLNAWFFSEQIRRPDVPGNWLSVILLFLVVTLLVLQPDIGQTILVVSVWGVMFFFAGMSWIWILILGGAGIGGSLLAYLMIPHVSQRIDRFLDPASGDTYQIDRAIQSFIHGGWFGRGPGEGTVKRGLPDSHTDFIFAVAAEEFGILLCLAILFVFTFIVLRGLRHMMHVDDPFPRLAIAGLISLFGMQAAINMAVNLHLIPAKGMTLPFLSYGGSSLLASALGMGLLLGFTRRRSMMRNLVPQRNLRKPVDHTIRG